jgi:hypothetical protein
MAGTMAVTSHLPPRAFSAISSERVMPTGPSCGSWWAQHICCSSCSVSASRLPRCSQNLPFVAVVGASASAPSRLARSPVDGPRTQIRISASCPGRPRWEEHAPPELETGSNSSSQGDGAGVPPPLPWLLLDIPCPLETHCSQHGVAFLFSSYLFSSEWERTHPCPATPPGAPNTSRTKPYRGWCRCLFNQILPYRAGAPQPCLLLSCSGQGG